MKVGDGWKVKYVVHAHGLDLGLFTNLMMKLFRSSPVDLDGPRFTY